MIVMTYLKNNSDKDKDILEEVFNDGNDIFRGIFDDAKDILEKVSDDEGCFKGLFKGVLRLFQKY